VDRAITATPAVPVEDAERNASISEDGDGVTVLAQVRVDRHDIVGMTRGRKKTAG
jgi:hypothetical protein